MAAKCSLGLVKTKGLLQQMCLLYSKERLIHTTSMMSKKRSGKVFPSIKGDKPITYEQSLEPQHIAHRKSWNSWNTTTIEGGLRTAETLFDDIFIRKFIVGTFHGMVKSEVIIKRQHNIVRIAMIIFPKLSPQKLAFLIGYTEELLSYWFQSPVKLEIQTIKNPLDVVFQYI
ncbi:hypothetical protein RUM43_003457 [Polyplax serrata]|uniref:Ribosomal protein S24 n=1 Tax=Polyplax serrata TaxID=468196 RepID=A0AAN8NWR5_POLSC